MKLRNTALKTNLECSLSPLSSASALVFALSFLRSLHSCKMNIKIAFSLNRAGYNKQKLI
jgi:hypothetical protein